MCGTIALCRLYHFNSDLLDWLLNIYSTKHHWLWRYGSVDFRTLQSGASRRWNPICVRRTDSHSRFKFFVIACSSTISPLQFIASNEKICSKLEPSVTHYFHYPPLNYFYFLENIQQKWRVATQNVLNELSSTKPVQVFKNTSKKPPAIVKIASFIFLAFLSAV